MSGFGTKRICAAATAGSRPAVLALATNDYDAAAGSLSYHGAYSTRLASR
jgi:hypothetical protein